MAPDVLDWWELRALTLAVTAHPRWRGRPVEVGLLRRNDAWGMTSGRVVRYQQRASCEVVVHELAHVLARTPDHDRAFHAAYREVDRLAVEVWARRLATRGPA